MPSSRTMSSRHCFMAPGEAMELEGWHNNSLAANNAPEAALDALDVCVGVCGRAECTAAAALGDGRSVAQGVEEAASSSNTKSSGMKSWCSTMWTMVSSRKTSKSLAPSPYLVRQMSERKSPAGWRNAPALNPKMRRGLSVLPVTRLGDEHIRTRKGLEWFGPPEHNTLLHCVLY
jgi:hypothetical protein